MNIGLLHYAAPPVVGGVESVLGQHARLMADAGHRVTILAGRGGQTDPRINFRLVPLMDSRHPEILAVKAQLDAGQVPALFYDLVARLREVLTQSLMGMDVIIAHNIGSLNKNLALTSALKETFDPARRPALILWHHDLAWTTPRYQPELHAGEPWDNLRTAWPGAIQVTISEERRTELVELFKLPAAQIQVIPNGVDLTQFLKLSQETQKYIHALDLNLADPLLLMPVRITPRKNIELALLTLARLRPRFPQVRLLVTGPLGPHNPANAQYFEMLVALRAELGLNGSAHFLAELTDEFIPDEVIADLYRLADALFLPSFEEGFGIPILEAGLAGLPVFCSDIPQLQALGGRFATTFSPEADPQAVADLIGDRLEHEPISGMRRLVKMEYTWQRIFKEKIEPLLRA